MERVVKGHGVVLATGGLVLVSCGTQGECIDLSGVRYCD